ELLLWSGCTGICEPIGSVASESRCGFRGCAAVPTWSCLVAENVAKPSPTPRRLYPELLKPVPEISDSTDADARLAAGMRPPRRAGRDGERTPAPAYADWLFLAMVQERRDRLPVDPDISIPPPVFRETVQQFIVVATAEYSPPPPLAQLFD